MKEIAENFGDTLIGAALVTAVLTVIAGTLYAALKSSVAAYISGLF